MQEILKLHKRWVCGAEVYSGSKNPNWEIDEITAGELLGIWGLLKETDAGMEKIPPLGYQGCWLRSPENKEWFTYKGIVTYSENGKSVSSRSDYERKFEKKVLANIPGGGSMPEGFSDYYL